MNKAEGKRDGDEQKLLHHFRCSNFFFLLCSSHFIRFYSLHWFELCTIAIQWKELASISLSLSVSLSWSLHIILYRCLSFGLFILSILFKKKKGKNFWKIFTFRFCSRSTVFNGDEYIFVLESIAHLTWRWPSLVRMLISLKDRTRTPETHRKY